jgi:hypothetical protein
VTSPSARKGNKAELEVARLLADLTGFRVRRKLGTGRSDDEGDLEGLPDCVAEVKAYRSTGEGVNAALADLERERVNAGTTFAVGLVKRPRAGWCAVMELEHFAALLREATG